MTVLFFGPRSLFLLLHRGETLLAPPLLVFRERYKASQLAVKYCPIRPELDVWHPVNGSSRAKRKESSGCQLDMPHTTFDRDMPPICPPTNTIVLSKNRPPPSLVSCSRSPTVDGRYGSETKLLRRKGGNLDRAVNHRAWDRVHT